MVKTVMIVGGQRKNLPFFWLAEFPGTERGKMYCQINAGGLYGLQSYVAQVEVDISKGLPCFDMVGLLDSEVRERGNACAFPCITSTQRFRRKRLR